MIFRLTAEGTRSYEGKFARDECTNKGAFAVILNLVFFLISGQEFTKLSAVLQVDHAGPL
jgi:hypothetical protein